MKTGQQIHDECCGRIAVAIIVIIITITITFIIIIKIGCNNSQITYHGVLTVNVMYISKVFCLVIFVVTQLPKC